MPLKFGEGDHDVAARIGEKCENAENENDGDHIPIERRARDPADRDRSNLLCHLRASAGHAAPSLEACR